MEDITISEAKERQLVTSLSREELEDRYLRLRESNTDLKKISHKQEDKMKQMATKLLRLVKDRKKLDDGGSILDVEAREKVEDLQTQVDSLEKQNTNLKSKLLVLRQQLQTHGKRTSQYDHVKSRVFTNAPAKKVSSNQQRIKEQLRVQGSPPPVRESSIIGSPRSSPSRGPPAVLPQPRYGRSLLEETRLEKRELEDIVANLQEQLQDYEDKVELLEMQVHQKDLNHEEDLQKLRQRVSGSQRNNIQENVDLIKLQREVKDKVTKLQHLQGKYQNLEELLGKVKSSHQQVLDEMEGMTAKLKQEKDKSSSLQNELKKGNISQQTLAQKEDEISDLKEEISLLKEAHNKLLNSTFDVEKDREHRAKERQYQLRIAQLEATVKADVTEKNVVLDRLTSERDITDSSKKEYRELQVKYYEIKEKHDDLNEKLKFFTKESAADFEEIQEALLLIKTKKERASQDLHFLEKVDDEINQDLRKAVQELQASHADTINELEKTRSMLLIQHNINKDYQKEVVTTTKKMDELKRECDMRVKEYAQLLDIRAQRIKKLESQLRDVVYGTKQYKLKAEESEVDEDTDDVDVKLERGQNVFEIHIGQMNISKNGVLLFDGVEPITFVSYEFFEYELQTTPVQRGARPDYNHTSQYVVQVDDFFLHYLQKESMKIEFHQAYGTEYKTLATSNIRFHELLDKSHGRLHARVDLHGMQSEEIMVSVEYWIRLRVPMEQALRLYKERTKAMGYLTANDLNKLESPSKQSLKDSGINELKITIIQCLSLIPKNKELQPCSYCIYKFFDFADHDTDIVKNSNYPQFHDQRLYPVPMTEELDGYLKNSNLDIYVFDDLDDEETSYLGLVSVPLITLAQDKSLKGKFQLINRQGEETGSIEVSLAWEYTYLPASAKTIRKYPAPMNTSIDHNAVYSRPTRDKMQPMVSAGKLFEPKITSSKIGDNDNEIMQPTSLKKSANTTISLKSTQSPSGSLSNLQSKQRGNRDKHPQSPSGSLTNLQSKQRSKRDKKGQSPSGSASNLQDHGQGNQGKARTLSSETLDSKDEFQSDDALLEEELRRTSELNVADDVKADSDLAADTMFQDDESEESDDDIVMPTSARKAMKRNDEIESLASDDTEDDVIVSSSLGKRTPSALAQNKLNDITITISSLTLYDDSPLLQVDSVQQLFVSYKFLDYDPEMLETPMSLPKPKPNRPIYFNFKKVFHIGEGDNNPTRQHLMHLLMPDHPNEGRLFFTVVSEPTNGESEECQDVGIAYVDFIQLLRDGKDFHDIDVDIYDLLGSESELLGCLTVTVEALDTLKSLYE